MHKIYVLDASGYLFRSYFAIRGMTNPKGQSTNALYGFIRSVMKLLQDFSPEYFVAVFDGRNNAKKRKELSPDYKAHRTEAPPDLGYQIEWAKQFCQLMGFPILDIPEVEADDTMGSVAVWARNQGDEVYLCSSDKDLCQLVDEKISVLNTHKDNLFIRSKEVEENFGVRPAQMIDYLAIVGDASDNIRGLSGFGPKTASKLLQEHQSLDRLLAQPDLLDGKKRETLLREMETVKLSRQLVTIDTNVPFPQNLEFFKIKELEKQPLIDFYQEMNFQSLIKEILGAQQEIHTQNAKYHCILQENDLTALLEKISSCDEVCFDTETTSISPLEAEVVGIGFSISPGEGWYLPMNGPWKKEELLQRLLPIFQNPQIGFYGHNVKYDLHALANEGISVANISFDTLLASYVLNAHQRQHSLDALSLDLFGKVKTPIETLIGKGAKQISMLEVPLQQVSDYCCEDVDYTCRLKEKLQPQLQERNLNNIFGEIELPLTTVLFKMERKGVYLDTEALSRLSKKIMEQLQQLEQEIYHLAGEVFNIKSTKQLAEILFDKLNIKPPKKTKTGFSTDSDVLENLSANFPIAEKILEFRSVEKLRSTYTETLPLQVNPKTGRVHCTFNQSVAATGRLSSQDPNLQNIPVRTALGREIRAAFKPEKEGWSYLSADYSQIELRLLAHLSGDPTMIEAFMQGKDIHSHTASRLFGIPIEFVTKEIRHRAKAVNFGVIYGQQAFGLARELKIGVGEASLFIENYFKRYGRVKEFVEQCIARARQEKKTVTMVGRERSIPDIDSKNFSIRSAAERLAVNTPLQGSAADLIKLAMLRIDKLFEKKSFQGFMVLQIHDELIFELPDEEIEEAIPLIREAMENVWELKVPLLVDVSIGKNWEQC